MRHRPKVFTVVAKQQGPRHCSKYLILATIEVLVTYYIIILKLYEPA